MRFGYLVFIRISWWTSFIIGLGKSATPKHLCLCWFCLRRVLTSMNILYLNPIGIVTFLKCFSKFLPHKIWTISTAQFSNLAGLIWRLQRAIWWKGWRPLVGFPLVLILWWRHLLLWYIESAVGGVLKVGWPLRHFLEWGVDSLRWDQLCPNHLPFGF